MPAAIAERDAAERQAPRPDRPERAQHEAQHVRGGQIIASSPARNRTDCRAGPASRTGRAGLDATAPRRRSSEALPSSPASGFSAAVLKGVAEPGGRQRGERRGVGAPGTPRIGREQPFLHRAQAGDGEPLGARENLPGLGLAVLPARPGAGVEQHRDDRQIEPGARRFRRIGAGCDEARAIDAAGREMPPAAVERHGEIGIAAARDRTRPARPRRRGGPGSSAKCRVSPRSAAAKTRPQRSRTAAAVSR